VISFPLFLDGSQAPIEFRSFQGMNESLDHLTNLRGLADGQVARGGCGSDCAYSFRSIFGSFKMWHLERQWPVSPGRQNPFEAHAQRGQIAVLREVDRLPG
jgi:hypothetical protein